MDEIKYKLDTNNSVLVVNAIDKLISIIKSKYIPADRKKFVLENEELKYLMDKCSSKETVVSLTACQGLLALVEFGVLEIGYTMSMVVTLLPSAQNYSAIISTMAGLLILDLKSRLIPGEPYKCQFSFKSPQHPFITVLEKNKSTEDDVLAQMQALCNHPDYNVSSNSLELLRPVFLWLTCNPQREGNVRPWQLMLSLPQTEALSSLLLACVSSQQICNPKLIKRAFAAYSAVTETVMYQQKREYVVALLPMLVRLSNELVKHGRDPRPCYNLIERCFALNAPELKTVAGITVMLLAENLSNSSALYLHELFNLCLNIISKYEYSAISLSVFIAYALQWLHLPSYLTTSALQTATKLLESQQKSKEDLTLHMPNLRANRIFKMLLYTDRYLYRTFTLLYTWERIRDNPEKLKSWLDNIYSVDDLIKFDFVPFLLGIILERRKEEWFEEIVFKALDILIQLANIRKELSVQLLAISIYKVANDKSPNVKLNFLKALPLMAKTKETVPTVVSVLNKLEANKGVPMSFLIMLHTSLVENQVRCFPYLQELLASSGAGRPDDLKWETDVAKAMAVKRICEIRASTHGLELVAVISSILNKCTDKAGSVSTGLVLDALAHLWRARNVAPASTWRAIEPKLGKDARPQVQRSVCKLLSVVPALRVATPEYDKLLSDAARKLWTYIVDSNYPEVVEAACDALANYRLEDYTLKDVPEIYRKTVKLPSSYCKTPADAARRPEDVLDYIPCEIWPELFKCTNQSALPGVQRLVSKLIEREMKGYRSGVYQRNATVEPPNLVYLQPNSVVRGLMECFRKQAISPCYDYSDTSLLSALSALSSDYPKPLPPCELLFLHALFQKGEQWKSGVLTLAARQAQLVPSAKRFMEIYLKDVRPGETQESEILLIFDLLPIFCRTLPPNTLRPTLDSCFSHSYAEISNVKKNDVKEDQVENFMFVKQVGKVKECLECEKIHEANRTLLSQTLENFFGLLTDDNVAWPAYVQSCVSLGTKYLERMTSPTAWWEVTGAVLRKACALRCEVASSGDCDAPLVWLSEIIDAQAGEITEQEYSLECMTPVLKAAKVDDASTREWFLQLMARAQVAFKETEDNSAKLYLCDVFMLSVIVFSGQWALSPLCDTTAAGDRRGRRARLPVAVAALVARPAWDHCAAQMLEWLCHTRDNINDVDTAMCCQRALLAARHCHQFAEHKIWTKMESFLGRSVNAD